MLQLTVRDATTADAEAVAGIHVRLWRAAYRGLIDQRFLDALSIADRADRWQQILWVLDGNDRADTFYERHGWLADGATKVEERPDLTLAEHRRITQLTP